MKRLYVLYDAQCAMCRHCRHWLTEQPAFFKLVTLSFRSPEIDYLFPAVRDLHPEEQLIVISDEGAVYRGEDAWIMCLYALQEYREWSQRLANPILKPFARRVCHLVSGNRKLFSRWFFQFGDTELAGKLSRELPSENACSIPPIPKG